MEKGKMKKGVIQLPLKEKISPKKDLLFSSNGNEIEITTLLLTKDFVIHDANLSGTNALFCKKKPNLVGQSFIDLLAIQQMDTQVVLKAFKRSHNSRFQHIKLEHSILRKWYCLIITFLGEQSSFCYAVTLITTNYSYQALKSYVNTIINNLPGAVYWKDLEGHYMGCNKFVAQMAGYENPEEMLGKTDYDFCWNEFADDWRLLDNKVVKENSTIQREEKVKLANGNVRTELTFKSPLKNEHNEIVGIIGNSLDITERKEMEAALHESHESQLAAESANVLKTSFIQNMQHDIRTPASSIWAVLEDLVKYSKIPDENLLVLLRNSAKQLYAICNEVIDFDRIERGDTPVLSKRINIREIIAKVIELNETAAYDRGLELSFTVDEKIPQVVKGDEHRVSRILINLLGNSLKFTPKGSISLSAHLVKKSKKIYIIQFKLQDTGIGIPIEKQSTLYEKFNRLNPANRSTYEGLGLGLRIVKKYVDDIEGEINIESAPRQGTTFFVDIPFEKALVETIHDKSSSYVNIIKNTEIKNKAGNHKLSIVTQTYIPSTDLKVLLIEDNELALTVAKNILTSIHCNITTAIDVKSSLEVLKQTKFDLVISDIGLPDGTGIDIINQVKKDNNSFNFSTPFIALTANADNNTIAKCEQAGFIQIMAKPLQIKNIQSLIDQIDSAHEKSLSFKQTKPQKSHHELVGPGLPSTEEELFKLGHYPLLDVTDGVNTLGDETVLCEILEMLVAALPKSKEEIEQAYAAGDWDKVEKLAHKEKGGVAYCGVLRMKYACQYLERYRKAGYSKLLEPLYQQLIEVLEETHLYLENWLKK
jgi:two-component system, OmpR family, aerobic respiration control sensor histidine kinase ArcB